MPEGIPPSPPSRITPGDISRHSFAIVRRGFDPDEVRCFLDSVARSIEGCEQREQELRETMRGRGAGGAPGGGRSHADGSLGQHSAQILRHAHDEAARIMGQAQERRANLAARDAAARPTSSRSRTRERRRPSGWRRRSCLGGQASKRPRQRASASCADAGDRASEAGIGEGQGRGTRAARPGARGARERVLADLARGGAALAMQIEQFRAARDEMAAVGHGVRDPVDGILDQLDRTTTKPRPPPVGRGRPGPPARRRRQSGDDSRQRLTEPAGRDRDGASTAARDADDAPTRTRGRGGRRARRSTSCSPGSGPAQTGADENRRRRTAGGGTPDRADAVAPAAPSGRGTDARRRGVPTVLIDEPACPPGPTPAIMPGATSCSIRSQPSWPHLKRALGDDQNRLLDLLRSTPGSTADELLGPEDEHLSAFVVGGAGSLGEAFAAGATFAGEPRRRDARRATRSSSRRPGWPGRVVTMLRRRIDDDGEPARTWATGSARPSGSGGASGSSAWSGDFAVAGLLGRRAAAAHAPTARCAGC